MFKWFNKNKKEKTSKDLIENVLNEAEKLNAFDEPEEAPEGWGSEPVLEEVQEQTEEEATSGAQEEEAAQEDFSETVAQSEEEPIETVDYIED
ncbi:MAG: hypothetical protein ACLVG9_06620, partial [Eubacteriales bacterium]